MKPVKDIVGVVRRKKFPIASENRENGQDRVLCAGQAPWHHCVESRGLWNMSTTRRRRSYEAGHKPKWLVVIDDTAECDRAVYFAARRAARVGASVVMLRVIETHDRNQQWAGVADIMKAEAHEEANASLDKYATRANGMAGITPERVVREGS